MIQCEPHVTTMLKRVIPRIDPGSQGLHTLKDNPESARDLAWFLDRYPMKVNRPDHLEKQKQLHIEKTALVDDLINRRTIPKPFKLALPPREYQSLAANVLLTSGGLLLADDVGLGKTAAAICTFAERKTLPALVVTLTHLPKQWQAEINKFAPELRTHIVRTGQPYDITKINKRLTVSFPDVVIISYSKLCGWAETLAKLVRSVVYDECQELRHHESDKYRAAYHISSSVSFRMGLSATPIYNYGGEMFNVMECLNQGRLGTKQEFHREWCTMYASDKPVINEPQAFGSYLRETGIMLRRTRQEVGRELPPLTKVPHHVDSDIHALDKVEDSCAELARIILAQGESYRGQKMEASGNLDNILRQATGIAKAPYVANFVRLLAENDEKVVLYGWHREVYSIWMQLLKEFKPVLYTGSESNEEKYESKRRFLSNDSRILIISLRSGAGLDGLQGSCRTVVFGELDWSPGVHEQCIGRVHRDGQAEPVVSYFLISETGADPLIAQVLGLKKAQIEGIRDDKQEIVEKLQNTGGHIRRLAELYLQKKKASRKPHPHNGHISERRRVGDPEQLQPGEERPKPSNLQTSETS